MKFYVGQKFTVRHEDGGVFSMHLKEELAKDYFNCYWVIIEHEDEDDINKGYDNDGFIHYHAADMNRWIREGKWNITVEPVKLPEDLFTL